MSRAGATALLITLIVCLATGPSGATPARVQSKHFVIAYDSETSFAYVQLVERGLEAAYDAFVVGSSFATFEAAVEVRIPRGDMDGMGAEYLEADAAGNPFPIIEIASEESMADAAGAMSLPLSLEQAVLSTTAHEFFHVLQDYAALQGQADISDREFIEPLATAAQEAAAPDADDYVDAALDFLFAPDAMPFLRRDYDGGLFWVFVLDRYGGLDALRRVMASSASYDGAQAIDRAFADQGLTFLDLWAKFAAALAANRLPDSVSLAKIAQVWRVELNLAELWLPSPIAVARWKGSPLTMDRVTEESPAGDVLGYSDSALDSPLRVSHPYGIDVVAIRPESSAPLAISVTAAETTDFRIAFVGRRDATWDLLSLSGRELTVRDPIRYDEIRIVVTRGETGTGAYRVELLTRP